MRRMSWRDRASENADGRGPKAYYFAGEGLVITLPLQLRRLSTCKRIDDRFLRHVER